MRVGQAVDSGESVLRDAGIATPRVDAEWLVGAAVGLSRSELYANSDRAITDDEVRSYERSLERRRSREPLAYVLGEWGFRRLTLKVDPRVLVPRPETEVVVGRCLELIRDVAEPSVLDVGTGSGAIALAIADEHPGARVTAIDVSADALAIAGDNANATGLTVTFAQHDVRDGLEGTYDLVVSNPPYVRAEELAALEPEVRDWEPREALLDDGQTEALAGAAHDVLAPDGVLVLEIHEARSEETHTLLESLGYRVRISVDLAGRDRVVEGRRT